MDVFDRKTGEYGAVQVIEMTLVLPVVLVCIWMLVYLGSYVLQSIYTYNTAQKVAMIAAREAAMPGYMYLYEDNGITQDTDFTDTKGQVSNVAINKMMNTHNPYRYIGDSFIETHIRAELEHELRTLINKVSFISASDLECVILTDNNFISKRVEVSVTKHVRVPDFIRLAGVEKMVDITAVAISEVSDSADFIRNTDMVTEIADYISDNYNIGGSGQSLSERISSYKLKFHDIAEKLGLG